MNHPHDISVSGEAIGAAAAFPLQVGPGADGALRAQKQVYESNKLAKRLRRLVGAAIADFSMIEAGDRVMVLSLIHI